MKKRFIRNLTIVTLAVTACCSHAQTKPQEASTKTQNSATIKPPSDAIAYSTKAIDLSVEKLPPNYAGNDPQQIYNALVTNFGPKGEFETTPQYQERLLSAKEKPLFGNLTPDSVFASTIDHSNDSDTGKAKMLYDADRQVLQVTTYLKSISTYMLSDAEPTADLPMDERLCITVKEATDLLGTYEGENAYGAKKSILKKRTNIYLLSFNNFQDFRIKPGVVLTQIVFELPIKPIVAKDAKPNLQTLILYRLTEPFTRKAKHQVNPTIQNPVDLELNRFFLNAKIEEIWFYNAATGQIYSKFRPSSQGQADNKLNRSSDDPQYILLPAFNS